MTQHTNSLAEQLEAIGATGLRWRQKVSAKRSDTSAPISEGFSGEMHRQPKLAEAVRLPEQMMLDLDEALYLAQMVYLVAPDGLQIDSCGDDCPRVYGVPDEYVTFTDDSRATIAPPGFEEAGDCIVIDDGEDAIVIDQTRGAVHLYEHVSRNADRNGASSRVDLDSLLTRSEDPWLYDKLKPWWDSKSALSNIWGACAFVRYLQPGSPERDALKRFAPSKRVLQAQSWLASLVNSRRGRLEKLIVDDAMELHDELRNWLDRTTFGEVVPQEEWADLCLRREFLGVYHRAYSSTGNDDIRGIVDSLDELGSLMLVDTNVARFQLKAEELERAVLAGARGWWVREHALAQ